MILRRDATKRAIVTKHVIATKHVIVTKHAISVKGVIIASYAITIMIHTNYAITSNHDTIESNP